MQTQSAQPSLSKKDIRVSHTTKQNYTITVCVTEYIITLFSSDLLVLYGLSCATELLVDDLWAASSSWSWFLHAHMSALTLHSFRNTKEMNEFIHAG